MKSSSHAPSATSLPRAPRDDVGARSTRYLMTMGIRIACFVLMVVITPYGWYTWVLGAAAVFLPYIAVVGANVGQQGRRSRREDPAALAALATLPTPRPEIEARVIRVDETRSGPDETRSGADETGPGTDETRSGPDGTRSGPDGTRSGPGATGHRG